MQFKRLKQCSVSVPSTVNPKPKKEPWNRCAMRLTSIPADAHFTKLIIHWTCICHGIFVVSTHMGNKYFILDPSHASPQISLSAILQGLFFQLSTYRALPLPAAVYNLVTFLPQVFSSSWQCNYKSVYRKSSSQRKMNHDKCSCDSATIHLQGEKHTDPMHNLLQTRL